MVLLSLVACGAPTTGSTSTTPSATTSTPSTTPVDAEIQLTAAAAGQPWGTQICVEGDRVYVAWMEDSGLRVLVSEDGGASWPAAPTELGVGAEVYDPVLHCDSDGVVLAWEDDRAADLDGREVYVNRSTDGGVTWLADDVRVSDVPPGRFALEPRLAAGGGTLVVAWYGHGEEGTYDVYTARSEDGGETWDAPVRVESNPVGAWYSARPSVAVSDDGLVVWVAWVDTTEGDASIYATRSLDGGQSFEADVRLDIGNTEHGIVDHPVLCADGVDELYVLWQDGRAGGDEREIHAAWSDDGGASWSPDVRVDSAAGGTGAALSPTCLLTDGTLYAAWYDDGLGDPGVWQRELVAGVPGAAELRLDAGSSEGADLDPVLRTDGDVVVAGWSELDASRVASTESGDPFDGSWTEVQSDLDPDVWPLDLDLAVSDGVVYAAWTDVRLGTSDVWFRAIDLD